MAKDNFKATDATKDAGYNNTLGTTAGAGVATGMGQQATGFGDLQKVGGQQQSFAQMLQQQASGQGGPTMADSQIQSATANNNANAAGFAASQKGNNPALAARQAMMAQAGNNQAAAGQAASTRTQEQLNAQSQEGSALQGAAGTAGTEAGAGTSEMGTAGSITNSSNANILNNQESEDKINAGVAAANTSAINGAISGLANNAGAAFGLYEGGEVEDMGPDQWEDDMEPVDKQYAYGGPVAPDRPPAVKQRSFAAQVAHHLKREYFDDGGGVADAGTHQEQLATDRAQEGAASQSDLETSALAAGPKKAPVTKYQQPAPAAKKPAPKKMAYGGEDGLDPADTDEPQDIGETEDQEFFAYGGLAGAHRDAVRRMALGGMVGPGAGRAGSAPSGEMLPEMQVQGMKVKYVMPKAGARGADGIDYHERQNGTDHRAPSLDLAAPVVTAATTARGFRNQLRDVAAGGPRSTTSHDEMEPLLNVGGAYRQPVAFAAGGDVDGLNGSTAAGGANPNNSVEQADPNSVDTGGKALASIGKGPAKMADGGTAQPNPAHDRRAFHPAGTAKQPGQPPAPDPTAPAAGAPPADNGFFHTLAQHFANSPMGKLIMGANKPATSSGTPLSPGEKPSQGAPLNSVPAETPDAGLQGEATRQTGSPVEGAAVQASDQDARHAEGGEIEGEGLDFGAGGPVPGEAEVAGNSLENDKVPAMLSPGEVVLPRTVAHKPHQAKRFVEHLRSNGGNGAKTLASIKKRKAA